MAKIILKKDLEGLVFELARKGPVWAPVLAHEHSTVCKYIFKLITEGDNLTFDYPATVLPPKELFLPPREDLFEFANGKAARHKSEKTAIFGVNLTDLEGISSLDQIFSRPIADIPYKERRENIVIVAIDKFSPPKDIPFDLYLMEVSQDMYVAFAKTREGQKIVSLPYFKERKVVTPSIKRKKDELIWDKALPKILEKSQDHKIWDELAQICFGCGICSYVCPLCYCFEIEDEVEFSSEPEMQGKRCRSWDSCMLSHFAEISNHNFRPELRDRIYNWYFHKFVRMPREYGFPGCVDCNRCAVFCPAKINYRKVLSEIIKDHNKKQPRGKK